MFSSLYDDDWCGKLRDDIVNSNVVDVVCVERGLESREVGTPICQSFAMPNKHSAALMV